MNKTIAIACDHGALNLKSKIMKHLDDIGVKYINFGTDTTDSVHYPIYADKVCNSVTSGESDLGILLCSTGIGMSIAANKHKGIRAACCSDTYSARLTRQHNNANVLCMGEFVVGHGLACDMVDQFIGAEFENSGRHLLRVEMLNELDENR
ncbi:MAG: ribose 5-phosphate isomerase B [Ruminococcaceae bacterium]|nr:ribose 5-phosphate isomerase B [Oscillospiraceae bacterium]